MTKAVKKEGRSKEKENAIVVISGNSGNTVSLTANRKYKDTVFRMLFSDKERLLELIVTVLNVNYGRNPALMEQCRTLADYAQYVALVRKYKAEFGSLEEAVRRAIDECINNDILSVFLRKNRAEVEMTSIFEYNQEEEERKLRAAERKAGYELGEIQGSVNAVKKLMQNMKLTMEQALEILEITGDERLEILEQLNKKTGI